MTFKLLTRLCLIGLFLPNLTWAGSSIRQLDCKVVVDRINTKQFISELDEIGLFRSWANFSKKEKDFVRQNFTELLILENLKKNWPHYSADTKQFLRRLHLESRDAKSSVQVERRPKAMTSGDYADTQGVINQGDVKLDTADPSIMQVVRFPDGTLKYRFTTSGLFKMEWDSPVDAYRGGIMTVTRSRGFYSDGTEFTGPYHPTAWPWDATFYQTDAGEQIVFGGVMRQPSPGQLPNVAEHNPTRSRWWGLLKHVKVADGSFEERVIFQEPLHEFNRQAGGHKGWQYHGYGGVLKTVFNPLKGYNTPIRDQNGFYELDYERVTVEKQAGDHKFPWETKLFTRKVDPSLKTTVGPEIEVVPIKNSLTGQYFEAARRGPPGEVHGYLLEGGNFFRSLTSNFDLTIFSGGDYVRDYGIFAAQKKQTANTYQPIVDDKGELIDLAKTLNLRKIFNGNWVGRGLLEYAPSEALMRTIAENRAVVRSQGRVYDRKTGELIFDPAQNLWLRFHYLHLKDLPEGYSGTGWAATNEIFVQLARLVAQVPVRIELDDRGQYVPVLDIDEKYRFMYEDIE